MQFSSLGKRLVSIPVRRALKNLPLITTISFLTLGTLSCEDMGGPPPRIIPGVSVDGVRMGDSKERVESLLGPPQGGGWIDGVWRTWRVYAYGYNGNTHRYSLTIGFMDILGDTLSPIDMGTYGPVDKIVMNEGYTGTTGDGIGIGTRMSEIQSRWGPPRRSVPTTDGQYSCYCFNNGFLEILFRADTVRLMTTGFFVPLPADTFHSCN